MPDLRTGKSKFSIAKGGGKTFELCLTEKVVYGNCY